ncbi:hypothetical protein [Methylobacterium planeticum]|uniref:Uncharacterized protein n=1 Tax=Methylobacterium planeticum TaxID=2615211 RepID=A0A6N6MG67_9HYPH|nr:hypothetical protein [Methylobacterium planeticum]KAB1068832.1 hypothetical protein F6X51_26320 [Methylobacterium planeticum]
MSIATLREVIERPAPPTTEERRRVERLVEAGRAELSQIGARIGQLEGETSHLLLTADDATLKRHEEKIATARRDHDRGAAIIRAAGERIEVSLQRDPDRRERLDAVNRDAPAVRKWLAERYPKLAAELAKGVAQLRELEFRIEAVNRDLPAGEKPVEGIEASVRRNVAPAIADVMVLPPLIGGELNLWPPDSTASWR